MYRYTYAEHLDAIAWAGGPLCTLLIPAMHGNSIKVFLCLSKKTTAQHPASTLCQSSGQSVAVHPRASNLIQTQPASSDGRYDGVNIGVE